MLVNLYTTSFIALFGAERGRPPFPCPLLLLQPQAA